VAADAGNKRHFFRENRTKRGPALNAERIFHPLNPYPYAT
jgi:hypothetical protein